MSKYLRIAINAAQAGGKHALSHFKENTEFKLKKDNTPVTTTDVEVEEIIKKTILKEFPDAQFFGEESGGDITKDEVWIIDPIDGTKNFIHGIPLWGTLIAFYQKGQSIVGVSYIPGINELLWAEKGKGAFLNDKKIQVSAVKDLSKAYLNYGRPTYFPDKQKLLMLINIPLAARGFGDAFSYHLLASGRIDITTEAGVKPYDVAPFKVIIEEAGGTITNFSGDEWTLSEKNIIATNGLLQSEVIKLLDGN